MSETRKLAAILVADVVGYSRLAGADEDRTLARLRGLRSDLIDPAIAAHHGRIVKRTGDGSIIEFRSVVDAVRCAIEVQNGLIAYPGEACRPASRDGLCQRQPSAHCRLGADQARARRFLADGRFSAGASGSGCTIGPSFSGDRFRRKRFGVNWRKGSNENLG